MAHSKTNKQTTSKKPQEIGKSNININLLQIKKHMSMELGTKDNA